MRLCGLQSSVPFCSSALHALYAENKAEVDAVKEALQLNLAMCYLKVKDWKRAKASCDSALELKESVKGLYRRAQVWLLVPHTPPPPQLPKTEGRVKGKISVLGCTE